MMKNLIYISYSRSDKEWKDRLLSHLKARQIQAEQLSIWDDGRVGTGSDWQEEVEKVLNNADAVILLVSADYLTSDYILNIVMPRLLERRAKEGLMIFPLIVSACPWEEIDWLKKLRVYPKNGEPLSAGTEYEIEDVLAELAETIHHQLKPGKHAYSPHAEEFLPQEAVSLYRLPTTGARLFGRERVLEILDEAWNQKHTHVVTLTAWGGVGKSALVNHWLNRMEKDDFRGAEKIYGWSFYSQGATEGKQASADEFMQKTLEWFGDDDPVKGAPADKGRRLADLVRKSRTLLVLDGMEPLQYPPAAGQGKEHGMEGLLKDQGLKTLLKELAASQPGLCLITSRQPVTDLSANVGFTVKEIPLEHLSESAGAELLKSLGIVGRENEITDAAEEYGGHALALTLLGRYIHTVYKGDIRQRDKIPALTEEQNRGGHARRVMEAYCVWLGESPERDILQLLGLFDRPAGKGALEVLKAEPAIPGLTGRLQQLSEADWQYALANLGGANLLAAEDPQKPGDLDCHPLVREHFAEKAGQYPEGWKTAHTRLYHYYRDLPGKELPDTLEEMEPLFAAIAHGCRAGFHQEALEEIFWKRIRRENEAFIIKKLGAFGADLSALSHFFEVPWSRPAAGLSEGTKADVLGWSAFGLRAVGRLREAVEPMKAGLERRVKLEDWKNAAVGAGNLSELMLTLGQVMEAVAFARRSVTHADRSGDEFWKMANRTTLADALHQSGQPGQFEEAERLFREAEEMQKKRQPEFQFLYSLRGFLFCDLLLGQGKYREVMERAGQTLEWVSKEGWLLDIALDRLTLGRAWLMQAQKVEASEEAGKKSAEAWDRAGVFLDQAVTGLRESGNQDDLPRGLLARASYYRLQGDFAPAWRDVTEAGEIAETGGMGLHLCDHHLEAARLCRAEGKNTEAKEHFRRAGQMIEKMGYGRRKGEKIK